MNIENLQWVYGPVVEYFATDSSTTFNTDL
jgi:hypothetical protein